MTTRRSRNASMLKLDSYPPPDDKSLADIDLLVLKGERGSEYRYH